MASAWAVEIVRLVEENAESIRRIRSEGLSLDNFTGLLVDLVDAAEHVITGPGQGEDKRKAVIEAVAILEDKYDILDKLDELLRLPPWLEPFDRQILERVLGFLVDFVVAILKKTVWRET